MLILLVWELSSYVMDTPAYFPPISDIYNSYIILLLSNSFWVDIITTVSRSLIGFAFAFILAVPIGLLLGWNRKYFSLFEVIIEFFRPLPSASVIPIAILFLGIDNLMKVFIISFGCFWIILINTIDGVRSINTQFFKVAKAFNFSKNKTFFKVILPSSFPHIFTGIKLSIAISLILTITVEMIVGGNGLGDFIIESERSFNFNNMYSGVFTIGIIGYLINFMIIKIEKKVLFWK